MESKIGILTFQDANNYGASLQLYSLYKKIEELGFKPEVINYKCPGLILQFEKKTLKNSSGIKNYIAHNIYIMLRKKRAQNFQLFRKRMVFSNACDNKAISYECKNFEKVIVGSDQVWNPVCSKADRVYLLDFCIPNEKKYCYAPSFGTTNNFDAFGKNAADCLLTINNLSCREMSGKEFVTKTLHIPCEVVLDPVFFGGGDFWGIAKKHCSNNNYIFLYNLRNSKRLVAFTKELSRTTGLKVIVINYSMRSELITLGRFIHLENGGPEEFVNLIYNASYVVTDSFHATAFSILFEKAFYVDYVDDNSDNNTNSRMSSLLGMLGMEDRVILNTKKININQPKFTNAKEKLEGLIEASHLYLSKILSKKHEVF